MKTGKRYTFAGIAAIFAFVLAMTLGACSGGVGAFTLTDIPAKYNGMHVVLYGYTDTDNLELMGMQGPAEETYTYYSVRISGGKARIPMWIMPQWPDTESARYSGSHTAEMEIVIHEENIFNDNSNDLAWLYFEGIVFKNGSAKASYNDADEVYDE